MSYLKLEKTGNLKYSSTTQLSIHKNDFQAIIDILGFEVANTSAFLQKFSVCQIFWDSKNWNSFPIFRQPLAVSPPRDFVSNISLILRVFILQFIERYIPKINNSADFPKIIAHIFQTKKFHFTIIRCGLECRSFSLDPTQWHSV